MLGHGRLTSRTDRQTPTAHHHRTVPGWDRGLTYRDVAALTGWDHGTTSGALSVLHKVGRIARLTEKRDRCKVYVLLDARDGREVEAPGRTSTGDLLEASIEFIEDLDVRGPTVDQRVARTRLMNRANRRED